MAQGIRNVTTIFDNKEALQPVRPARAFGVDRVLKPFDLAGAIGAAAMRLLDDGRYAKVIRMRARARARFLKPKTRPPHTPAAARG